MRQYKDGYVPFRGFETYYKSFDSYGSTKTPLLVLHGGPGSYHNYLLGLSELAADRRVVFYDQLGGGLSDRPKNNRIWSVDLFIEELKTVRSYLGLEEVHLLGHSWGGMLAIEYMISKPTGVKSLVLASAMVSMPLYQQEVDRLKKKLPPETYKTMVTQEAAGTTDSEAYQAAMKQYNNRHIYRGEIFPKGLKAPEGSFCKESYQKLWGVSEAWANGSLKNWNRIPRLKEIAVPTLITSGQHDELTPEQAALTHDNIPNSQLEIFAGGSHLVHVERAREYLDVVSGFLKENDEGITGQQPSSHLEH